MAPLYWLLHYIEYNWAPVGGKEPVASEFRSISNVACGLHQLRWIAPVLTALLMQTASVTIFQTATATYLSQPFRCQGVQFQAAAIEEQFDLLLYTSSV